MKPSNLTYPLLLTLFVLATAFVLYYEVNAAPLTDSKAAFSQGDRPQDNDCGVTKRGTIVCWGDPPSERVHLANGALIQIVTDDIDNCRVGMN